MSTFLAEIDWNALLNQDASLIAFVVAGVVGLISVTAIVMPQWRRAHEVRTLARLKGRMIERGFSADEIVNVINAGTKPGPHGKPSNFLNYPQPLRS